MDLGGGSGYSTADQSMAASGTTGSVSSGFSGPSGGGGDNNDPYQDFVQASQPRGLSAIQRAVQSTVQKTKDFLSQPTNRRGIIGSLIGGALLGPFGAFLGGSLGQRYGGAAQNKVTDFFTGGSSPYGDYIPFTNPRFENQFTMPMDNPNVPILTDGGIATLRDTPEIKDQMAKLDGLALTQMRILENKAGMAPFTGKPLTDKEQKTLDKLREMDADPNKIYTVPINIV